MKNVRNKIKHNKKNARTFNMPFAQPERLKCRFTFNIWDNNNCPRTIYRIHIYFLRGFGIDKSHAFNEK